jgi:hypothetical protein
MHINNWPPLTLQVTEGNIRITQLFLHDPDNNMIEICNVSVPWQ